MVLSCVVDTWIASRIFYIQLLITKYYCPLRYLLDYNIKAMCINKEIMDLQKYNI